MKSTLDIFSAMVVPRNVFNLLIYIQTEQKLIWHYSERHHGKGPMGGIGGTIKNPGFFAGPNLYRL